MDMEGSSMVDGRPGRQSHSGSRLACETGCDARDPVTILPLSFSLFCLFWQMQIWTALHFLFSRSPKRRRSRSNSRTRRSRHRRSRSRDRRHHSPRSRSQERREREKERERRQKGLPPSKDETLSGESSSVCHSCFYLKKNNMMRYILVF